MTDSTVLTPDTIKEAAVDQGWHVHRRRRGYTLAYGSDRLTVAWDKRQQLRHAALHVEHPVTVVHQFNDLTDPLQTAGLLRCLARHPSTPAFVNLIAHLDDGRALYVPGAGHRGEPLGPYALTEPVEFRYHPLNPVQLPRRQRLRTRHGPNAIRRGSASRSRKWRRLLHPRVGRGDRALGNAGGHRSRQ